MEKGIRYVALNYPGLIALKEKKIFILEYEGTTFSVLIHSHQLALKILDFDNKIENKTIDNKIKYSLKSEIKGEIEIDNNFSIQKDEFTYILNYKKNKYRTYNDLYYTELVIQYEVVDTKDDVLNNLVFDKLLHFFINSYRLSTSDFSIQLPINIKDDLIIREYIITYTKNELDLPFDERFKLSRSLQVGFKQFRLPLFLGNKSLNDKDLEGNTQLVENFIKSNNLLENEEILLKAKEEFEINMNYKYALLFFYFH